MAFLGNATGTSDQCAQPRCCGMPVSISSNGTGTEGTEAQSGTGHELQSEASSLFTDGSTAASGSVAPPSNATTGYSGWLEIAVDIASIRFASSLCQHFAATLFASRPNNSSSSSNSTAVSGFVLHRGSGEFVVLAAPRVGSAAANATVKRPNAIALPAVAAVLGTDDPRAV